jgi:integrase
MKRPLTDAAVKRLKPPAKGQVDVVDAGYRGLALRLSYAGSKSWCFFFHRQGKLHRMTLGQYPTMSLAEAREAWRDARKEVQAGRDPRQKVVSGKTFALVAEEWLKREQDKNRTAPEVRRIVQKYLLPHLGKMNVGEITKHDLLKITDALVDEGKPIMARRVHARLHRFLRWCVDRDLISANPIAGMRRPATEKSRDRVLTDNELAAIWRAADKLGFPYGTCTQLLILTGARRSEITKLKWSEIDGDRILLPPARTKTAVAHLILLAPVAQSIIDKLPLIVDSEFAFTTNGKSPVSGWSTAKPQLDRLSGVRNWHVHDLRRTVATGLQKLGIPLQVTEAVLGHTSGSRAGVVGIYQRHDFMDEKRTALEAWASHVRSIA